MIKKKKQKATTKQQQQQSGRHCKDIEDKRKKGSIKKMKM